MTVAGVTFHPEPRRAAPERAARPSEEASFSRTLDEAEPRDEAQEARSAEEPAGPPAEKRGEAAPAPVAVPAAAVAPVEQPPSELTTGAVPALPESSVGQAAAAAPPGGVAPPTELLSVAGSDAATVAPAGGGAPAPSSAPASLDSAPLATPVQAEGETTERPLPPGGVHGASSASASASPSGAAALGAAASLPGKMEEEALQSVKVLRHAAAEATAPEAKAGAQLTGAAHTAGPQTAAPTAAALETRSSQAAENGPPAQQAPASRQAAASPALQVAVHLARAVEDGVRRLEVRLNPAELGRVEVKLDLAHDGRALAVVSAERQETLDLLQRDSRNLERALQEAGIRTDSGSLSFNLRQNEREPEAGYAVGQARGGRAHREDSSEPLRVAAFRPGAALRALDISV